MHPHGDLAWQVSTVICVDTFILFCNEGKDEMDRTGSEPKPDTAEGGGLKVGEAEAGLTSPDLPQDHANPTAISKDAQASGFGQDMINFFRGYCMGAADTVPGVSGGTVALILGHYQRLVAAISHVDVVLISLLRKRSFSEAIKHVDGRFLAMLGMGILAGVATLAGLMHWLLDHRLPQTLAVFLGLLLASVWIVQAYVDRWTLSRVAWFIAGASLAVMVSQLPKGTGGDSLLFLFGTASIAICAMILPGISGAFVLVVFGSYHTFTGLIKDFVKLNITVEGLLQLIAFGCGCLFGLLACSRLLNWLLAHYRSATMAVLMGLMVGSVAKLWPLQVPTPATAGFELKDRVMQYVAPADWTGSLLALIALGLGSFVAVMAIEWYAKHRSPGESS